MFARIALATALAATLAGVAPALGSPALDTRARWYALDSDSSSELTGCFGPCQCIVRIESKLSGLLRLSPLGVVDGIDHYAADPIDWQLANGKAVTGTGSYLFDPSGPSQQLALDLSIGGAPPAHFDSGMVPGNSDNGLRITIARHAQACIDTEFVIAANRIILDPADVPANSPAIARLAPNPFTSGAELDFALPSAGRASLVVTDVSGRVVRSLLHAWLAAGMHPTRWDGRDDAGTRVPPGVYFVRLETGNRTVSRPIVRLR